MKYKVTFDNGQSSVYDTKTPFDEFKMSFPAAVSFEELDKPVVVAEEVKPKRAKKAEA